MTKLHVPKTYTHIPEVDLTDFIAERSKPYAPETDDYRRPPFAAPVKAGKNTQIYNVHSYHTKVPSEGIVPYIKHYTEPDDVVLDPFCGSGMTGVACLIAKRYAILNDLSPAATHIAYNYCTPVDVDTLQEEFRRIQSAVKEEFDWLYGTICDRCGRPAVIQYTIWSDVFECGRCRENLVLWDVAVDHGSGRVQQNFVCPTCGKEQTKKGLRRVKTVPVMTNYECSHCRPARGEHATTEAEKQRILEIETLPIPYWYPKDEFPLGRQTRKIRKGTAGISRVDEIYTKRNLWALASLWAKSEAIDSPRVQLAVKFALTGLMLAASKMNRHKPSFTASILMGTLYVGSFIEEANVMRLLQPRIRKVVGLYESQIEPSPRVVCRTGSAVDLGSVPSSSVDYIFTDPPFGSNLQYAELNFIWESWLQQLSDWSQDCVMNYVHKKDLEFYSDMMARAFLEMFRVLKPGRWASVVFHNTDDAVWRAIQAGAQEAGFDVINALAFDKKQGTFNQVNMGKDSAAGFDIVLNLHKPHREAKNGRATPAADMETTIAETVAAHLSTNPMDEHRTTQYLHSLVIRQLLVSNILIEEVTIPLLETVLPHYFKQVEGRWYLRGEAIVGGRVFEIRDETDAISWLTAVLGNEPQTAGDLVPQWQMATLRAQIAKPLDQILEENFWRERRTGRWQMPTAAQREKMSARQEVANLAQMRQIRRYLAGELDLHPAGAELCGWVQFAYEQEMFEEAVRIFAHVHQPDVSDAQYQKTRKIARACRLRAGQTADDPQPPLF